MIDIAIWKDEEIDYLKNNYSILTNEDLQNIEMVFLNIHNEKLGYPITKELHRQFHSEYGIINFTEDNLDKFMKSV